jgi:hypothetical protein
MFKFFVVETNERTRDKCTNRREGLFLIDTEYE